VPQVDPIILQLRAETSQLRNELRSTTILVQDQMNQQTRSITRLEATADASTRRIGSSFAAMGNGIKAALAGIAIGAVVRELADLADQAKQLEAQLRLATNGFGTLSQAQSDVQRISEQTRGSLEATTKLYAGFVRASRETGRSQQDAARATQTFAEALKIGGASTEEAASATLQFNQALQSGVLRGDEFNSIMEASPRIARLLADALGVPIGQLRKMAEEGQITSDVLFKALTDRKFTAGIDAEFKQIPVTFGDAMQAMENAAITSFGQFDKGGRFSEAIVGFLGTGTDTFRGLTSQAEQFGIDARAVFDGLGNLFDPIGANGQAVFDALGIRIFSVREQITSLLASFDQVYNFYADANNIGTRIENAFVRGLNRAQLRAGAKPGDLAQQSPLMQRSNLAGNFSGAARLSAARGRLDAAARRLEAQGYIVPRNADGTVNEAGIVRRPQTPAVRPATVTASQAENAKALAKHQGILADLEKLKVDASKEDLATINRKIAREKKIVANLEKGVSLSAATAAAGGSGRTGKSEAEKQAEKDKKFVDALLANISRDAIPGRETDVMLESGSARTEAAARQFRDIFGEMGKDYEDPFKSVKDYDTSRDVYYKQREDAEEKLQQQREQNVYQLAGLFESALTQSSDQFWENFKRNALKTLAFIAAQAVVTSFSSGGGGFGSLLGNLGRGLTGKAGGNSKGGILSALGFLFGQPTGIPGFATGGSMLIGGSPGVDQNLLSLNGQPIARVSRGETLNVNPGSVAARGNSVTVHQHFSLDARGGLLLPEFVAGIQGYVDQTGAAAAKAGAGAAKAQMPANQKAFSDLKAG